MKYYSELSKIENSIIRLECMESMLRVIANGVAHTNLEDASNALWHLEGIVEDIHNNLRSDFNELWDIIREERDEKLEEEVKSKKKNK